MKRRQWSTWFKTRSGCLSSVALEFLHGFVLVSDFVRTPLSQLPPIINRSEYSENRTSLASWSLLRSGSPDSLRLLLVQPSEVPFVNHLSDSGAVQIGIRIQKNETSFTVELPISHRARHIILKKQYDGILCRVSILHHRSHRVSLTSSRNENRM
jgi:hypothetical protein